MGLLRGYRLYSILNERTDQMKIPVSRVGAQTVQVPPKYQFELPQCAGFDAQLPFEVGVLVFHLVDLPKGENALTDDPGGRFSDLWAFQGSRENWKTQRCRLLVKAAETPPT